MSLRCDFIMTTCPCNEYPRYTPPLYSKIEVYTGIHFFLIFALKHRLWVLVRTRVPTVYVWSKNKKNITIFHLKFFIFLAVKKSLYIAWVCFRNVFRDEMNAITVHHWRLLSCTSIRNISKYMHMMTLFPRQGVTEISTPWPFRYPLLLKVSRSTASSPDYQGME